MSWQNYPVVRFAIPLIVGMAMGYISIDYGIVNLLWLAIPFILCSCAALYVNTLCPKFRYIHLFGVLSNVSIALFGALLMLQRCLSITESVPDKGAWICGVVESEPKKKARTYAVEVRTNDSRVLAYIALDESHSPETLHSGDSISLQAYKVNPTFIRNDADSTDNHILDDYRNYLFCEGFCATCYVLPGSWDSRGENHGKSDWTKQFADIRSQIHLKYADAGITDDVGSVVEAMTTGQRANLNQKLRQAYAHAGVAHVLALSGMHLAMLFVMFNYLVNNFMTRRWRRVVAFTLIPVAWLFCMIAGMPPSLLRATIMLSLVQLALVIDAEQSLLNSCAIAAVLMLFFNPLLLMNIGFQLSFASIVAIALTHVDTLHIDSTGRRRNILTRIIQEYLWPPLRMSLVCTLATFPLVAYYFGYIPLLGLLSSVVISTLVSILLIMLLLWWMFTLCGLTTTLLTSAIIAIVSWNNTIVDAVASIKIATVDYRPSTVAVVLLYVFIISVWNFFVHRTSRSLRLSMLSLTALLLEQIIVS